MYGLQNLPTQLIYSIIVYHFTVTCFMTQCVTRFDDFDCTLGIIHNHNLKNAPFTVRLVSPFDIPRLKLINRDYFRNLRNFVLQYALDSHFQGHRGMRTS